MGLDIDNVGDVCNNCLTEDEKRSTEFLRTYSDDIEDEGELICAHYGERL